MNHFSQGQVKTSQKFKKGIVQAYDKGPSKMGKFGEYCTIKLTIDGDKYNLPFQDPNAGLCFIEGDTVQFMYEDKVFTKDGKDFPYKDIDKKTFGVSGDESSGPKGSYQAPSRSSAPPTATPKGIYISDAERQYLIIGQSSLAQAVAYNAGKNVGKETIIADMEYFADEVIKYAQNKVSGNSINAHIKTETSPINNGKFEDDDVPF